ncbi:MULTISPECIES: Crp/Fnr family transcriptional regulator [unclassified Cellulophaga]|uniref:Crp/Fnr family transcriptional regulator n=1 Tax=unclassified Cellulophaga TaxID=2634405 RepID=UPI0026E3D5E6|nr:MULTISPECIES: Crp/Fnr family transcriptional regulator [unclassified Cellulophaga]MDO6491735.1 Crp/Fnr family transcriptional regulator [Cellulophaga sp. 2_MG-2023]MDO6495610.1 Crp/Fnr family transcriptional regulator [Cellulophaga sp. 3_MG-2023]
MKSIRPDLRDYETFSLYKFLKEKKMDSLNENVFEVVFDKNEYLYEPPKVENYIYEIVTGAIKLGGYSEKGDEYTYAVLHTGEFFGNLMYLNGQFSEFAKALVDVRVRVYDLNFFKKEVKSHPISAEWFFSYLTKRWYMAEKKLCKVNEKSITDKLNFLKTVYNFKVLDANGKAYNIHCLLTQKDKGDLIGATRQTIANALKNNQFVLDKIPG